MWVLPIKLSFISNLICWHSIFKICVALKNVYEINLIAYISSKIEVNLKVVVNANDLMCLRCGRVGSVNIFELI